MGRRQPGWVKIISRVIGWLRVPPGAWILFCGGVAFALVLLKWLERILWDKIPPQAAFGNAWITRFGNHSTYLLLVHAIAIFFFSSAIALKRRSVQDALRFNRRSLWEWPVVALTLIYWGFYLRKVCEAPDPGTFCSTKTGSVYGLQFIEGLINLLILFLASFYIIVAFRVATYLRKTKRDVPVAMLLISGCSAPITALGFLRHAVKDEWLKAHWQTGNNFPGLIGYTFMSLILYGILLLWVLSRSADVIVKNKRAG